MEFSVIFFSLAKLNEKYGKGFWIVIKNFFAFYNFVWLFILIISTHELEYNW